MPCDTRLKPNQTISQRAAEVRAIVAKLDALIARGAVKVVIDRKTGAVAFPGLDDAIRDGVTDACCFRRIMATGSTAAKLAVQRAELLAGRSVNRQAVAQGWHSHDGGAHWHHGHRSG